MTLYRDYDAREVGMPLSSFRYVYEEVWSGCVVDTLYTDSRAEVDQLIPRGLAEAYDVRVTGPDGVEWYRAQ